MACRPVCRPSPARVASTGRRRTAAAEAARSITRCRPTSRRTPNRSPAPSAARRFRSPRRDPDVHFVQVERPAFVRNASRPPSFLLASRLVPLGEWNGKEEGRSATLATLHPDSATVRLHDGFADGEAEAGPDSPLRLRLPEGNEQLALLFARNAGTVVGDHESGRMIILFGRDRHVSALRRELDGVPEQVAEHLKDALAVRRDDREPRRSPCIDVDALLVSEALV